MSMTIREFKSELIKFANEEMSKWGLDDWTFSFNNTKTMIGLCDYKTKSIHISNHFIKNANYTMDAAKDTVLHEIAHAKAGFDAAHGPVWKRWARKVGADPSRTKEVEGGRIGRYRLIRFKDGVELDCRHRLCDRYRGLITYNGEMLIVFDEKTKTIVTDRDRVMCRLISNLHDHIFPEKVVSQARQFLDQGFDVQSLERPKLQTRLP